MTEETHRWEGEFKVSSGEASEYARDDGEAPIKPGVLLLLPRCAFVRLRADRTYFQESEFPWSRPTLFPHIAKSSTWAASSEGILF